MYMLVQVLSSCFRCPLLENQTIKAFLSCVPDKSMLILDLFAEVDTVWIHPESFFGKPFIWCMLQNFGGLPGIYGNLATIATAPMYGCKAC